MRTRNFTQTIYRFSELSDKAKQRAKDDYANAEGYAWQAEQMDSLKALAAHFGGELADWSIDFFGASHSSAKFAMPEMSAKEIKELLGQLGTYNKRTDKGHGDCKLTGFCGDEDAIDGFRIAWRNGERDLSTLMDAAFDSWLKAAQTDCEYQYSDEAFAEHCEANDYEFHEDGRFVGRRD
jgi:hypothetical protein